MLSVKTTYLALSLILLLSSITLSYSHVQYIQYKVLLPNGNIIHEKTPLCGSCMIALNKTIYVHVIYDEEFFKEYNASMQHTELKITIGEELKTYNTIHIFYKNKTYAYELYYEVNKKILLYGIITNTLTGEEYDIVLSSNLESITWSPSTTGINTTKISSNVTTTKTTIQINTTSSIGTSITTQSEITKTSCRSGSANVSATILLSSIIVLIVLIIIFSIMRRGHGTE